MTMRKTKRYTVQSFKKKERVTVKKKERVTDPYAIQTPPKGLGICPDCQAVYFHKRWSLPGSPQPKSPKPSKNTGQPLMSPQPLLCPACRKIRDGYAEGFVTIKWANWLAHKTEALGLIHHEEQRACQVNPLERIMNIRTRADGADIETTTERMAQRIGRELNRAFRGQVQYKWSHKDKLARVEWMGPGKQKKKGSK